jgi:hypothetical protein
LQKFLFFRQIETWLLILLCAGLFPALLSWSGFLGVDRFLPLSPLIGVLAALFALYSMYRYRMLIGSKAKEWIATWSGRAWLLLIGLFVLVHGITNACMFFGGINNTDQFRGLAFTSAFAANFLKPAHPLDLSIPVSYGYYFYEYTAFLYSAVGGYGWPTVALLTGSFFCIFAFYFTFQQFVKRVVPNYRPITGLLAVCALSFYGLDFMSSNEYHGDWWNFYQITQMAAYWSWVYHYLLGGAFALAALTCLYDALTRRDENMFLVAILLFCIAPFYATITGIFFAGVFLLAFLLAVACDRSLLRLLRFGGNLAFAAGTICGIITFLLLPQIFTFWGRGDYLSFHEPVLWFTQKAIATAGIKDWAETTLLLMAELGVLHFIALCLVPLCVVSLYRTKPVAAALLLSLAIIVVLSLSCVQASTLDWYWRGGNFGIIILTASTATWLFSFLPCKRSFGSACLWLFVLLLLSPGVWNFYTESLKRFKNGYSAPAAALEINHAVGLHTAIGYSKEERAGPQVKAAEISPGHPWHHAYFRDEASKRALNSQQDVIITMAHQAGRIAIAEKNPLWTFLDVYSLSADFLSRYFNWKGEATPCGSTWFGASIPQNTYARVDMLEPLKIETRTCAR